MIIFAFHLHTPFSLLFGLFLLYEQFLSVQLGQKVNIFKRETTLADISFFKAELVNYQFQLQIKEKML